jgi:hypothetical protein
LKRAVVSGVRSGAAPAIALEASLARQRVGISFDESVAAPGDPIFAEMHDDTQRGLERDDRRTVDVAAAGAAHHERRPRERREPSRRCTEGDRRDRRPLDRELA